ncbi:alpha/beta fold hydrolase [Helicobacter mehlei]|uniref:Alpha/beta hydrolase n=1 Tax=Helicobacter mehlei TaxID=2316080 RepID=A0A553UZZ9_9HELI|nr:alpha/beta hydrolase [Helicobacter mehlei]TSA85779.1 alpha/beta hydrolase [Helicobacter mehlei]
MARRRIKYRGGEFEIAYDFYNRSACKNVVFLHGWGSSKELMQMAFKPYFAAYNHFYVDLPGFGKSPNDTFLTPSDYAQIIDAFFNSLQVSPDIAIGHSFGGKVATLCQSKHLVLLSSAGILIPKSFKTRAKIKLAKCLKAWGLQKALCKLRSEDARDLNPAMYEVFKYTVQENFEDPFRACQKQTLIIWGQEDTTTPLEAGQKIAQLIPHNHFVSLQGDHYFFLKQGAVVEEHCAQYLEGF